MILLGMLNKTQPKDMTREQFIRWFTGFVDGEGNFTLFIDGLRLRAKFRINLHIDDVAVLHTIRTMLGVGKVSVFGNTCVYTISDLTSLKDVLCPLLAQYGLFTSKWLDFMAFSEGVKYLSNNPSLVTGDVLAWAKQLINSMNSTRTTYDTTLMLPIVIDQYWLLGFIEAEGTFGFKNLFPYFQVGQHTRSLDVINAIREYIQALSNGFTSTLDSAAPLVTSTLNTRTSVMVISVQNIDALYDYLMFHLLDMPFQTRKGTDFYLWRLVLYMYKWGYAYLKEGRQVIVLIAGYINSGRYSTSSLVNLLPSLADIQHVLTLTVPIIRTPDMTQLEFSKAIARTLSRTVYIYDNGTLMNDKPYTSYADALEAIGISRTSAEMRRKIDTGKTSQGRYTFYSTPQ